MSGRSPSQWSESGIRSTAGTSQRIEQDLLRLRQAILERHNVKIPIHDPICIEFTMHAQVLERTLAGLRQERNETVEELKTVLHSANHSVHAILEDAGKPLAKAMADTFEPRTVANRVMVELIDDLRRECRNVVRETRRTMAVFLAVALGVCLLILYLASQRLSTAEQLLHITGDSSDASFEPPPIPPSSARP